MEKERTFDHPSSGETLRWGFVGTGSIANWMAAVVQRSPAARLTAIASRRLDSARTFAERCGAGQAFGSWQEMLSAGDIDAVYIATPTSLREDVAVSAARAGKHVLAEKPFASAASVRRIRETCRENRVGFMDATHFVHHPRYAEICANRSKLIGDPLELDTTFGVCLGERSDIRYDPALEPLGAIGDLGWYNMRAMIEYLTTEPRVDSADVRLRRDGETGTVIGGEGTLDFADGTRGHWRCGFDAEAPDIRLEMRGSRGTLRMDNFVGEEEDHSASYRCTATDAGPPEERSVHVASASSGPALMFRNFAGMVGDDAGRERWGRRSELTQVLVDYVMQADG